MIKDFLKKILSEQDFKIIEVALKLAEESEEQEPFKEYMGWCEYNEKTGKFKF